MIRLRGHHLVCLHFFKGEGYSREFIENLSDVLSKVEKDEEIEVVEGADDVCRACPSLQAGKCASKPDAEQEVRKLDRMAMDRLGIEVGGKVLWRDVKTVIYATTNEWFAAYCRGCEWERVCIPRRVAYL